MEIMDEEQKQRVNSLFAKETLQPDQVVVGQSPTPKLMGVLTPVTMSFYHAMKQVTAGKKIHKLEWGDKEYYGFLNGDILSIHKPDNVNYQWIISKGDLMGEDWIVI